MVTNNDVAGTPTAAICTNQVVVTHVLVAVECCVYIVYTMVGCAIYGCNNKSERDRISFHKLPAIRTNEGPQMLELTTERRRTWLSVISRDDLKNLNNVYVCGNHFVKGEVYRLVHSLSA